MNTGPSDLERKKEEISHRAMARLVIRARRTGHLRFREEFFTMISLLSVSSSSQLLKFKACCFRFGKDTNLSLFYKDFGVVARLGHSAAHSALSASSIQTDYSLFERAEVLY